MPKDAGTGSAPKEVAQGSVVWRDVQGRAVAGLGRAHLAARPSHAQDAR